MLIFNLVPIGGFPGSLDNKLFAELNHVPYLVFSSYNSMAIILISIKPPNDLSAVITPSTHYFLTYYSVPCRGDNILLLLYK